MQLHIIGLPGLSRLYFPLSFFISFFIVACAAVSSLAWTAETYWKEGAPDFIVAGRAPIPAEEQLRVYHQVR